MVLLGKSECNDFVEKMHNAAKTLHEWQKQGKWVDEKEDDQQQEEEDTQRDVPM